MFKDFMKMKREQQIFCIVAIIIILVALFWPRERNLIDASLSAHLGNIGGKIQFEALETLDEGFEGKTMALFYAPWCGHCKKTIPEWDKFKSMNKTDVKIVKIDCDKYPELAEKHGIKGYPTIYFLPYGLNNPMDRIEYKGDRKGEAFLTFVVNK